METPNLSEHLAEIKGHVNYVPRHQYFLAVMFSSIVFALVMFRSAVGGIVKRYIDFNCNPSLTRRLSVERKNKEGKGEEGKKNEKEEGEGKKEGEGKEEGEKKEDGEGEEEKKDGEGEGGKKKTKAQDNMYYFGDLAVNTLRRGTIRYFFYGLCIYFSLVINFYCLMVSFGHIYFALHGWLSGKTLAFLMICACHSAYKLCRRIYPLLRDQVKTNNRPVNKFCPLSRHDLLDGEDAESSSRTMKLWKVKQSFLKVGDYILLQAGDEIPADCVIVNGTDGPASTDHPPPSEKDDEDESRSTSPEGSDEDKRKTAYSEGSDEDESKSTCSQEGAEGESNCSQGGEGGRGRSSDARPDSGRGAAGRRAEPETKVCYSASL